MPAHLASRLAVCSWSLHPATPQQLLQDLESIGIPRIQLALDPLRSNPDVWRSAPMLLAQRDIEVVAGMFGTVGEDYSTPETIKRTGGVVPDATWEQNCRNIQQVARIAGQLALPLVTFHAGFLPHEESDPDYSKLLDRISRIAELFGEQGIALGFETGQETAETLRAFLEKLDCANVGVNFDPANMILYEKGDPIAALRVLAPFLRSCHLKDATATKVPGTWGDEVVVGTGQVDWRAFFRTLDEVKFKGHLSIEREAGTTRVADIVNAKEFVLGL
ncbi:MAG: sugar phosphate isomerase/epimerase [Verrucomicrobia bacterium]|nr:sugar phosphate isomerase/epimerase [Verrucomicrobiota bacterium]